MCSASQSELEKFAISLLERFKPKPEHNNEENDDEANVAATVAIISAAHEIDLQHHQHLNKSRSGEIPAIPQTIFNPQTPDIKKLALRLRIPPDVRDSHHFFFLCIRFSL